MGQTFPQPTFNSAPSEPVSRREVPRTGEIVVKVACDSDIVAARRGGREQAAQMGFSSTDSTLIATSISELARNIVIYAKEGTITIRRIDQGMRRGVVIVAHDEGPGIANVDQVLKEGFSTSGGLGLGLVGTRRLMDEFEIESQLGKGTRVTVKKWVWSLADPSVPRGERNGTWG